MIKLEKKGDGERGRGREGEFPSILKNEGWADFQLMSLRFRFFPTPVKP